MAKVVDPLMSLDATGTIGRVITYTKSQKVQIAKGYRPPRYTRTEDQENIRDTYANAVIIWNAMTPAEKKVYDDQVGNRCLTGYNLFIQEYMNEHKYDNINGEYEGTYYEQCIYTAD